MSDRTTSWESFETALAMALSALKGESLVLSTREGNRFVQVHASPGEGIFTEAVSNAYLAPTHQLDDQQLGTLRALGWAAPTHAPGAPEPVPAPHGSPNHFREFPTPCSCAEVARFAVRTLADALRVTGPGELVYKAFDDQGHDLTLPVLGIEQEVPRAPPAEAGRKRRTRTPYDALRARVRAAARVQSGMGSLEYEENGSLIIPAGTRPCWIHVYERPFFVRVHVHLTSAPQGDEGFLERLHDWNCRAPLARLIHQDGEVYLGIDVPAAPFRAEHLAQAVSLIAAQSGPALAEILPKDAAAPVRN